MSEFHTEAPQTTATEGLAQGPYMAARAGFETTTLQTKGNESTIEPPRSFHKHYLLQRAYKEPSIGYITWLPSSDVHRPQ